MIAIGSIVKGICVPKNYSRQSFTPKAPAAFGVWLTSVEPQRAIADIGFSHAEGERQPTGKRS